MTDLDPVPAAAAPAAERPLPGTRAWFVFFVAWMVAWAVVARLCFGHAEEGDGLALRVWLLAVACFYLSLCNVFLPLPTTWAVFLVATPEYSVVNDPWLHVPLLAAVLATATVVANLNEYHLLGYLVRFGLGERIRRARVYGWALRWFQRSPFQLLMLMAFIPIPVDAVRWLAILSRYPRLRFGLAYFVGRWLRYLVFAACSTWWALSPREIVIFQLVLAGAALALRLGWALRRGLRRRGQGAVGASEPATVASAMFTARARSASDG